MTDELSRRQFVGAAGGTLLTTDLGATVVRRDDDAASSETAAGRTQSAESWPTFQYDAANTGVAPEGWTPIETPLTEQWSFKSQVAREGRNEQYLNPVVADGLVVIGTGSNNCYALEAATGEHRWTFETIGTGTPAIDGDTVYVGSLDNYLYALEAATGEVRWELDAGSSMQTAPVVVDGTVYAQQTELGSAVMAVDADTGEQLWSHSAGFAGPNFGAPSVVDGSVYAAGGDSNRPDVISIDAATGKREWGFRTDRDVKRGENGTTLTSFGNPTAAGGTVYVGSEHGYCYALDAADGSLVWEREIGELYGSPAVAGDTVLFSVSNPGKLVALDAGNGQQQWVVEYEGGSTIRSSPVVVGDRVLATSTGSLYIVDIADGTVIETYGGGVNWLTTPAVVDGVVYTGGSVAQALAPSGAKPGETLRTNEGGGTDGNEQNRDSGASGSVFTRFSDSNALVGLTTGALGFAVGYLGYRRFRQQPNQPGGRNRPR